MGKVLEIGISFAKGSKIQNLNSVEAIKDKGLLNDRKFKENNKKECQITLIEIENIVHFNKISQSRILSVDFRRNIITEGVNLNNFLNKEFFVGNVKLKGHDLCRPCKYLQEKLKQNNFIRDLLNKGGLRCEIISSGIINVGDIIK